MQMQPTFADLEVRLLVVVPCVSVQGTVSTAYEFRLPVPSGAKDLWKAIHMKIATLKRMNPDWANVGVFEAQTFGKNRRVRSFAKPDLLVGQPGAAKEVWRALVS